MTGTDTDLGAAATGDIAAVRPQYIAVRATINLDGLRAGEEALIDPTMPYMQELLRAQYIVPLPARLQPVVNRREGT
jgi:hypothetical protein